MRENLFLLSRKFRPLGYFFIGIGLVLGLLRFKLGLKPEFLNWEVFAIYSLYLEPFYLKIISNQMLEEISGLFILFGLFSIAFSKEKEENKQNNTLRLNAFFISTYLNFLFLVISLFFTYGLGFIYMMIIQLFLFLIVYIISFRVLLLKVGKKRQGIIGIIR